VRAADKVLAEADMNVERDSDQLKKEHK
jgi:hypothetical protein